MRTGLFDYVARKLIFATWLASMAVLLPFLLSTKSWAQEKSSTVLVTTFFLKSMSDKLLPGSVRVEFLDHGGAPHHFDPTPADAKKIQSADLIIQNGLGLEAWLQRLIQSFHFSGEIKSAAQGVDKIRINPKEAKEVHDDHDSHDSEYDPHAWLSPLQAKHYITTLADLFKKTYPAFAKQIEANKIDYLEALSPLQDRLKVVCEQFSKHYHGMVVTHAAFAYLAKDCNIDVMAIQDEHMSEMQNSSNLTHLIRVVKKQSWAFFLDDSGNDLPLEVMVRDLNETISGRLLTKPKKVGETEDAYLSMLEHNISQLGLASE